MDFIAFLLSLLLGFTGGNKLVQIRIQYERNMEYSQPQNPLETETASYPHILVDPGLSRDNSLLNDAMRLVLYFIFSSFHPTALVDTRHYFIFSSWSPYFIFLFHLFIFSSG